MPFDKSKKLSEEEAEELASRTLEEGSIIITNHAQERMGERNFQKSDIYHILKTGKVTQIEPGDFDNWKYRFSGEDLEGEEGNVIVSFMSNGNGIIITVF